MGRWTCSFSSLFHMKYVVDIREGLGEDILSPSKNIIRRSLCSSMNKQHLMGSHMCCHNFLRKKATHMTRGQCYATMRTMVPFLEHTVVHQQQERLLLEHKCCVTMTLDTRATMLQLHCCSANDLGWQYNSDQHDE